ncbi:cytochrome P450 [Xylariaceae sp. FL0804]|nr:cytochrome P450 [Xylariaceae sp. FL0804]
MDPTVAAVGCLAISIVYWSSISLYRLYWHPLARYPGPSIAAISTSSWEFYWNYYNNGRMIFEIERLHRIHGTVIRIGVNDLHVSDPEVYQDLTRTGSKFTKDVDFYRAIAFPGTSIGETDPERHRVRRKVLAPALSGRRVQELAPAILAKTKELLARLEDARSTASPICITSAAKAFTMDIISKIVLGKEMGCVADPDFHNEFTDHLDASFRMGWTATAFPLISALALKVASTTNALLFPIPLISLKRSCLSITREYLDHFSHRTNIINGSPGTPETLHQKKSYGSRSAVIEMLMDQGSATGHVLPSLDELNDELLMLLIAGNDTTSMALIFGIYQIATCPAIYRELVKELTEVMPTLGEDSWITYEQARRLPYLNAVVKEILRLGNPLPGRLPRTVPPEGYRLYGHWVPPGINIHTSAYLLNRHPSIWEDPYTFKPERWIKGEVSRQEKYLATFSRGARQCLGKDLAWCELLLVLSNLFRRFEVTPYKTTEEDMNWIDIVLIVYRGKFSALLERRAL